MYVFYAIKYEYFPMLVKLILVLIYGMEMEPRQAFEHLYIYMKKTKVPNGNQAKIIKFLLYVCGLRMSKTRIVYVTSNNVKNHCYRCRLLNVICIRKQVILCQSIKYYINV